MIHPLDCGLLRDGLVVGGFDLVVDYPSPEAISRQACPAEIFLTEAVYYRASARQSRSLIFPREALYSFTTSICLSITQPVNRSIATCTQ